MKKKGFTLIELIAVIILLAVIALIVYPSVVGFAKNAKEKAYEQQIATFISSAKRYTTEYNEVLDSTPVKITIDELIKKGYIKKTKDGKIYSPIDNTEMNGCIVIDYSDEYMQYTYSYTQECN